MGRKTLFTEELAETICARIASGESLIKICKDPKLPSRATVFNWLLHQDQSTFLDKYLVARAIAGHACADQILGLTEDLKSGEIEPSVAREISANLRWSAERMAPRYYSARQTLVKHDAGQLTHEQRIDLLR